MCVGEVGVLIWLSLSAAICVRMMSVCWCENCNSHLDACRIEPSI